MGIQWGASILRKTRLTRITQESRVLTHANNNTSLLVLRSISEETLIVVTADHSHSLTISGNARRGNPILGFQSKLAMDGKPALSLSYADGPVGLTGNQTRANLTGVNYNDPEFQQQALIKMVYESHAAEDVGQFIRLFLHHFITTF